MKQARYQLPRVAHLRLTGELWGEGNGSVSTMSRSSSMISEPTDCIDVQIAGAFQ